MNITLELQKIYKQYKPKYRVKALSYNIDLIKNLKDVYGDLPLVELFYCGLNEVLPPYCEYGNRKAFKTLETGYRNFCSTSNKCTCKKLHQGKKISSYQRNLTEEQRTIQKQKAKYTSLKRYGVENPMQTEEIQKKQQETMLLKYGVRFANQADDLKFKKYKSKTGFDSPLHDPTVQQKTKDTTLLRYGTLMSHAREAAYTKFHGNPFTANAVQEKSKQTLLEKYGVLHPLQSEEIVQQMKRRLVEKYGCENVSQKHIDENKLNVLNSYEQMQILYKTKTVMQIANELNVNYTTVLNRLLLMGIKQPKTYSPEEVIKSFLIDNQILFDFKNRTIISPLELDFFLPEYNVAIEHCGLYWHSSEFKDNNYHLNKWKFCKDKNVRLITIFEDELVYKQDIVLSTIKSLLGKTNKNLYARKCQISIKKTKAVRYFLDNNHLQGSVDTASIHITLEYENTIVAVMSFRKRNNFEYELVRYCTLNDTTVVGAASKCFSFFVKTFAPSVVISFSDNRWFSGGMYSMLGFVDSTKRLTADYYYIEGIKRIHKFNMRKEKIKNKFSVNIENKTEKQLVNELNILRIYDCGKKKWVWTA